MKTLLSTYNTDAESTALSDESFTVLTLYMKQRNARVSSLLQTHSFESKSQVFEMFLAASLERLLSNIGGTLGLWMGASVISLLHLLITLLRAVLQAFKALRRNK